MDNQENTSMQELTIIIKECIMESIMSYLPKMIEDILPTITNHISTITQQQNTNVHRMEAERIFKNDRDYWNSQLDYRENILYKQTRCKTLLETYSNCLTQEPMYIPRKFRKDAFHTNSKEEKKVIDKLNLQQLKTEMELLTLRNEKHLAKLKEFDANIEIEIMKSDVNEEVTNEMHSSWNEKVNIDMKRIQDKWNKKSLSIKEAHKVDQNYMKSKYDDNNNQQAQLNNNNEKTDVCITEGVQENSKNEQSPNQRSKMKRKYQLRSSTSQAQH